MGQGTSQRTVPASAGQRTMAQLYLERSRRPGAAHGHGPQGTGSGAGRPCRDLRHEHGALVHGRCGDHDGRLRHGWPVPQPSAGACQLHPRAQRNAGAVPGPDARHRQLPEGRSAGDSRRADALSRRSGTGTQMECAGAGTRATHRNAATQTRSADDADLHLRHHRPSERGDGQLRQHDVRRGRSDRSHAIPGARAPAVLSAAGACLRTRRRRTDVHGARRAGLLHRKRGQTAGRAAIRETDAILRRAAGLQPHSVRRVAAAAAA